MEFKGATMLLALVFACIASISAKHDVHCETCVKVDGICYNLTYLFDLEVPFRKHIVIPKMGILRSENRLYFSFEPESTDPEYYKIGFVNLDKRDGFGIVNGSNTINNFGTFDIDQQNKIVYVGGSAAICSLDADNKAIFFSSAGESIKIVFVHSGKVFFVKKDENKIVEKKDDKFIPYEQYKTVKNFVIDNNNMIVFLNNTGLYANKIRTNDTVYLSKNNYIRGLTVDLEGVVYAWWLGSIYKVDVGKDFEDTRLVKVAQIEGAETMTFDNDNNIVFQSQKRLFRLSRTSATTCNNEL